VPALIHMATDDEWHGGPPDSPVVWAPGHARRALEPLRAQEAIAPLVELLRRLDADMDDWIGDGLPRAMARFGLPALAPLSVFLANTEDGDWSRVAAAKAIGHVGQAHPKLRLERIARLNAQPERFAENREPSMEGETACVH
jgi:HEAT repeat protein